MKKNFLISFFTTFLLCFISVAYAAFNSELTITGEGLVEKDTTPPTCGAWYLRDSSLTIQEAYNQNKFINPGLNTTWTDQNEKLFIECTDNMPGAYGCINVTEITDNNNNKRYFKEVKEYTTNIKSDGAVSVTLQDAYLNERTCTLPAGGSNPYIDKVAPEITINRTAANKFSYIAEDNFEVLGYMVTTTPTEPALDDPNWLTEPEEVTIDNTEAKTYYVWAKDGINITYETIQTFKLTKNQGAGTTLNLTYQDANGDSLVTSFVLDGTEVYVTATVNAGYNTLVLKNGNTAITSQSVQTVEAATTISSSATPDVYSIVLDNQLATVVGTNKVWYRYNTSTSGCYYYTNSSLSTCLTNYTITKPEKDGYTFGGYYTGTNGSGTVYVNTSGVFTNNIYKKRPSQINANYTTEITLYAKWTAKSYTVTASSNGGSIPSTSGWTGTGASATKSVTYGSTYGTLPTPTKTGHTFSGWQLLPDGYTQLDYIQSSGTQYINTGITPDSTTAVEVNFNTTSTGKWVFGSRTSGGSTNTLGVYINTATQYWAQVGGNNTSTQGGYLNVASTSGDHKLFVSTTHFADNESTYINYNTTISSSNARDLYLLAMFQGSVDYRILPAKIYRSRIWKSGSIVRDYIPCIDESTGTVGLFDLVSGTFFGNNGTGTFTPGNVVYITSETLMETAHDHVIYAKWEYNATPTITRNDYNTFSVNAAGSSQYLISTTQTTKPAADAAEWGETTTQDVSTTTKETWYVWIKAANGVVSDNYATITNYKVTLSAGTGTTLTAKADNSSTGTSVTNDMYVLSGTTVYPTGALSIGYDSLVVKKNVTTITNGSAQSIEADTTFATTAIPNKYLITYDYRNTIHVTFANGESADTGYIIDWDKDFTINGVFKYGTAARRYLVIGNYDDSDKTLNIEITTANKFRIYLGTGGYDEVSSTTVGRSVDITYTFSWVANTQTYTFTATGSSTNISMSDTYNISGQGTKTLKYGTRDNRSETSPFTTTTYHKTLKITEPNEYGTTLNIPTTVTKPQYTLNGWYTATSGGTAISSSTPVPAADTTYYAQWTANTYQVKFNANGGSGTMANQTYTYDVAQALTQNAFTRSGYTFIGWSANSSGATTAIYYDKQSVSNLTKTNNGTYNVYALWRKNDYDVVFDGNTSTSGTMANQTLSYGVEGTLSANGYDKTGYTYVDWNTNSLDTGTSYNNQAGVTINANMLYKTSAPTLPTNTTSYAYSGRWGKTSTAIAPTLIDVTDAPSSLITKGFNIPANTSSSKYYLYFHYLLVEPNQPYTLSVYAKGSGNLLLKAGNSTPTREESFALTNTWQRYSMKVIPVTTNTAGTYNARTSGRFLHQIGIGTAAGNGEFQVAGLKFEIGETATEYVDSNNVLNLHAQWVANELVFDNKVIGGTYNPSENQTITDGIDEATNGTGTYTYAITGGNSNNYFSLDGRDIIIAANTPVNTSGYAVTITATDSNSGATKSATYQMVVNRRKPTITLTDSTKALTYPTGGTNTYVYTGDGTVNCESSDSTYVTCSVDSANNRINVTPVKPTSSAVTITVSATAGANYSVPNSKTFTVTVAKGTCPAPSNVAIATAGTVTWTVPTGASSSQISINNTDFTAATSGVDYKSTIIAATGTRTVYVRSVCDTTYYSSANSSSTSKSTTVFKVTLNKGTGISTVTGAGNYITGSTAAINATVSTGYTWNNWTGTSTISTKSTSITVNAAKTYTANATPNTYTINFDKNDSSATGTMPGQIMTYGNTTTLTPNTYVKAGYSFKEWNTAANGTGTSYLDKASVSNLVTSGTITLYAQWVQKAKFDTGANVNIKMKTLAGADSPDQYYYDENITSITRSPSEPSAANKTSEHIVSVQDSPTPIYMWFDDTTGTIYWWSEDPNPYLNEDASCMFNNLSAAASIDVTPFDTSIVTNMEGMFANNTSLASLDVSNFDTSNVTNMNSMFTWCISLASLDVSNFDTSNVTDMSYMFDGDYSIITLDVSNFDMSSAESIGDMFNDMPSLRYLTTPSSIPSGLETYLPGIFKDNQNNKYYLIDDSTPTSTLLTRAYALLDTGANVNTKLKALAGQSNPTVNTVNTNIKAIIYANEEPSAANKTSSHIISASTSDIPIYAWYDDEVIYIWADSGIPDYYGAIFLNPNSESLFNSLQSLKIMEFWFTPVLLQDADYMFKNCSSLKRISLDMFYWSTVTSSTDMFYGDTSLNEVGAPLFYSSNSNVEIVLPGNFYDSNDVTSTYNHLNNISPLDTTFYRKLTKFDYGYNVNIKLKRLSGQIACNSTTTNNTSITKILRSDIEPSSENKTSNHLISDPGSTLPIYAWYDNGIIYWWTAEPNPYLHEYPYEMFRNLTSLQELDLDTINTSNSIHMDYMFDGDSSLVSIDVSNFDTSNALWAYGMFRNCNKLTELDLSSFNLMGIYNLNDFISGTTGLRTLITPNTYSVYSDNSISLPGPFVDTNSNIYTELDKTSPTSTTLTRVLTMLDTGANVNIKLKTLAGQTNPTVNTVNTNIEEISFSSEEPSAANKTSAHVISTSISEYPIYAWFDNGIIYVWSEGEIYLNPNSESLFNSMRGLMYTGSFSPINAELATDVDYMFKNCSSLLYLFLNDFINENVTSTTDMLYGTTALDTIITPEVYPTSSSVRINLPTEFTDGNDAFYTYLDNTSPVNTPIFKYFAKFDTGTNVNIKMKTLAGATNPTQSSNDKNITAIVRSNTEPSSANKTSEHIVSAQDSDLPIYMWYDNGTIYWWSEDSHPYLNEDASYMFYNIWNVTSIDVNNFNTGNTTNMTRMFAGSGITSLDLSNFNTINVTNMYSMFEGCSSLTSLDVTSFNTRNVTNFSCMFAEVESLTSLDLSSFDMSSAQYTTYMVTGDASKPNRGLNTIVTPKVYPSGSGFSINLPGTFKTSNGTIYNTLTNSSPTSTTLTRAYTMLDIGPNVNVKLKALAGATNPTVDTEDYNITRIAWGSEPSAANKTSEHVISASTSTYPIYAWYDNGTIYIWSQAGSQNIYFNANSESLFNSLRDLSTINNYFNKQLLTDVDYMFKNCWKLTNIGLNNYIYKTVTSATDMLYGTNPSTIYTPRFYPTSSSVEIILPGLYVDNNSNYYTELDNTSPINTSLTHVFAKFDTGANVNVAMKTLAGDTNPTYNTSNESIITFAKSSTEPSAANKTSEHVVSTQDSDLPIYMWFDSTTGTMYWWSIDPHPYLNEDASYMFAYLVNAGDIDVSDFNTSLTTEMGGMFYNDTSLSSINLSNFDTYNVTGMSNMFEGTDSLLSLDLSSFDMSGAPSTAYMLGNSINSSLTTIVTPSAYPSGSGFSIELPGTFRTTNGTIYTYLENTSPTSTTLTRAYALLDTGTNVNVKLKTLSGQSNPTVNTVNTAINTVILSSNEPSAANKTSSHVISASTSDLPIYAWYENNTIYIWSEGLIYLNANSESLFNSMQGLTNTTNFFPISSKFVTDVDYMFKNCSSLTMVYLEDYINSGVTSTTKMLYGTTSLNTVYTPKIYPSNSNVNINLYGSFADPNESPIIETYSSLNNTSPISVELHRVFTEFDTGANVNVKMKKLAGDSAISTENIHDYVHANTNITSIVRSQTEPSSENKTSEHVISSQNSDLPIYAWFDSTTGTMYWWSIDDYPYLNENAQDMFSNFMSVTNIDLTHFNTSNTENMETMFIDDYSLTSLDLSNFDTRNVTDFGGMFAYCMSLTTLDISSFDMTNAQIDDYMFASTSIMTLTTPSAFPSDSNVIMDLPGGFTDSNSNTYTELGSTSPTNTVLTRKVALLDTGANVNIKLKTLAGATNPTVNTVDNNIISMDWSSEEPSSANKTSSHIISASTSGYPVYAWYDNGVIYIWCEVYDVFLNPNSESLYNSLNSLQFIDYWVNPTLVTDADYMYKNCSSLETLNLTTNYWSNVTSATDMLYGTTSLNDIWTTPFAYPSNSNVRIELPATFIDQSTGSTYNYLNNTSPTNRELVKLYSKFDTGSNVNAKMKALAGNVNPTYDTVNESLITFTKSSTEPSSENKTSEHIVSSNDSIVPIYMWFDSTTGTMYWWSIDEHPYLNEDSSYMFGLLTAATSIDVTPFDTSLTTNMTGMFAYDISLSSLDLSDLDTSNVTNMSGMFAWDGSLSSIDLSDLDTSNVTDMSGMFANCSNISSLDLSSFDMSSTLFATDMLNGLTSLIELKTPNTMFINATSTTLSAIDLPYTMKGTNNVDYTTLTKTTPTSMWLTTNGAVTVTFNSNGGSVVPVSKLVITGGTYGTLPTPTKSGYVFKGWATSSLPDGYTEVEYIESSGTQWIDTGVTPSTTIKMQYKFRPLSLLNSTVLFLGVRGSSNASWGLAYQSGASLRFYEQNSSSARVTTSSSYITTGTDYNLEVGNLYIKNLDTGSNVVTGTTQSTATTNIGTIKINNSYNSSYASMRTYRIKIYDGSTLIRDFVPCINNTTNKAGLYDIVNNTFYGNSGSGNFTAGNEVSSNYITSSTVVTKTTNHTLNAQWGQAVTVTFNPDGGTVSPTTKDVIPGETYGELPTPTKTGYTFNGWKDTNSNTITAASTVSINSDHTLTADYTKDVYAITYNLDGGSVSTANPASYSVDTATITLNNPTKTGYAFTGWTGSNGSTPQTTVTIPVGSTGAKSYTANWGPNTYTITVNRGSNITSCSMTGCTNGQPCNYGTQYTITCNKSADYVWTNYQYTNGENYGSYRYKTVSTYGTPTGFTCSGTTCTLTSTVGTSNKTYNVTAPAGTGKTQCAHRESNIQRFSYGQFKGCFSTGSGSGCNLDTSYWRTNGSYCAWNDYTGNGPSIPVYDNNGTGGQNAVEFKVNVTDGYASIYLGTNDANLQAYAYQFVYSFYLYDGSYHDGNTSASGRMSGAGSSKAEAFEGPYLRWVSSSCP